MDGVSLNPECERLPKSGRGLFARLFEHYHKLLASREQWVGFASQSFFHNPYLAAMDMFFVHPGAMHGLFSRCWANGWAMLGTTGLYSQGRDRIFKRLGLMAPNCAFTCTAAVLADTVYGFVMNVPGFILNYKLGGCPTGASIVMGCKACASVCWSSTISGGLFDSFRALDSDDAGKKARVPAWIRWLVIDRFELKFRKKLIWICLAASVLATAAIYSFGPGGLLR